MKTKFLPFLAISAALAALAIWPSLERRQSAPVTSALAHFNNPQISFAQVPLNFEPNVGQMDKRVHYVARGAGYTIFLTQNETVLSLQDRQHGKALVRLNLDGAMRAAKIEPLNQLLGKSNYFIGNDPKQWHTDVSQYSKVRYSKVYPGIDVVYHGNQRQLEYDFVVAPGANPSSIKLNFTGADKIDINAAGDLVLHAGSGELVLQKPIAYQQIDGERRNVVANYVVRSAAQARLEIEKYDSRKELIIDPVFLYSTYLGGTGNEQANAIAVDAAGNAYVAGQTNSFDFPVTPGAPQGTQPSDTANGQSERVRDQARPDRHDHPLFNLSRWKLHRHCLRNCDQCRGRSVRDGNHRFRIQCSI